MTLGRFTPACRYKSVCSIHVKESKPNLMTVEVVKLITSCRCFTILVLYK